MLNYTDEELRAMVLPMALKLVDQEIYRVLGRCNTKEILAVTNEFVNIIKYNDVNAPATEVQNVDNVVAIDAPTETASEIKYK